jgi:hypothetical protein
MVTGSVRLGPLSDYTANFRPVLSPERAPNRNMTQLSDSNLPTGLKSQSGLDTKTY